MDSERSAQLVRGTDTTALATKPRTRAHASLRRFLESLKSEASLDPNEALKGALANATRRKAGAFFTGPEMARALVTPFGAELRESTTATVLDPACGAGELLVAASEHFTRSKDAGRNLESWEARVFGRDLFEEFVLSARMRMFRAAKPQARRLPDLDGLFPGITRGCSLSDGDAYGLATHLLMNPPFTLVRAPAGCEWRTGRVSSAALFMETAATRCEPGTRIAAVLPDVLRSGSGYEAWRRMLARYLDVSSAAIVGRFARWADVDVFLLHATVRSKPLSSKETAKWPRTAKGSRSRLANSFAVSVGPVVDYRSPHTGAWRPYLTVDTSQPWETVAATTLKKRRFEGKLFKPPFVVIRRTSRAGDTHRMVPTVITGSIKVAVENHLVVVRPNDGTFQSCQDLVARLRAPSTTAWLNERIRCRHLTVGAVCELPMPALTR